jgi:nitrous oxidase accessory protein
MSADGKSRGLDGLRVQILCTVAATALLLLAAWVPFWQMTLRAPQYPAGLRMTAYGTEVIGDLREINIINHYVGMEHIDTVPAPEMGLFPFLLAGLIAAAWLALLHRWLARLATAAILVSPFVILADLQWWLHTFGRNLDPTAPIKVEPFTPLALGISKISNFDSTSWVSWGFFAMIAAGLLVAYGARRRRRAAVAAAAESAPGAATVGVAVVVALLVTLQPAHAGQGGELQRRIDAAAPGSRLEVGPGTYDGPVRIEKPLHLVGVGRPVIRGNGTGSVVTIGGEAVTFEGFVVRNSGRAVSEEAAGIKVAGSRHVIRDNLVEDVYFGIHLSDGGDNVVVGNDIRPGERHGARPGHAISLWHQSGVRVADNRIREARDGIYLTFADDVVAEGNDVRGCRYGIHSMYSENSRFVGNHLEDNLLGGALMYSDGLQMRCNTVRRNREGATAYGILLKDIDSLLLQDNLIIGNRVGVYADSTPVGRDKKAIVRGNVIAGNDAALALQGTVRLTFYDNQVSSNLADVRAEGGALSDGNVWAVAERGNYWDAYRGYDADGDGIGDLPYRYEMVMNELLRHAPASRAFVYTPASLVLERAVRLFPVYRFEPLLIDPYPLMSPPRPACVEVPR